MLHYLTDVAKYKLAGYRRTVSRLAYTQSADWGAMHITAPVYMGNTVTSRLTA